MQRSEKTRRNLGFPRIGQSHCSCRVTEDEVNSKMKNEISGESR